MVKARMVTEDELYPVFKLAVYTGRLKNTILKAVPASTVPAMGERRGAISFFL